MNHIIAHDWLLRLDYLESAAGAASVATASTASHAAVGVCESHTCCRLGSTAVAASVATASVAVTSAGASAVPQAASVVNAAIAAMVAIFFIFFPLFLLVARQREYLTLLEWLVLYR
jgi:hypothetical protein